MRAPRWTARTAATTLAASSRACSAGDRPPAPSAEPGEPGQRRLARPADEERHAEREELVLAREQLEVLRRRLAEADAGVDDDALAVDARPPRAASIRSRRNAATSRDDVVVDRFGLHRSRRAAHVHQADAAAPDARRRARARPASRSAAMSLTMSAPRSSATRMTSTLVVSIETGTPRPTAAASTGTDAGELVLERRPAARRPARLAADVEDVGAFGEHLLAAGDRLRRRQRRAAFGERVGRDVDDSHHARPREVDREAARPPDRAGHEKRGRSPVAEYRCEHRASGSCRRVARRHRRHAAARLDRRRRPSPSAAAAACRT